MNRSYCERATKPAPKQASHANKKVSAPGLPRYLRGGQALPQAARAQLEAGFGEPLGHLKLHTDEQAARLNARIDAEAFTLGSHIFLAPDQPPARLDLLAHEVAHALQQPEADPSSRPLRATHSGDATERAAERAARDVVQGRRAERGPATGVQVARQPRSGSASGLTEEALEDLAAIGEGPSPFIRLSTDPSFELQQQRFERGNARQASNEAANERRIQIERALWDAQVHMDELKAKTGIDSESGLGDWLVGGGRYAQANIREGGDSIEQWLKDTQVKSRRQAYSDADAHSDDWYGPLLRANAVVHDMSSEFSTGFARGGVTLGTGLLGAVANPIDSVGGLLNLGNDLVNPFADKKELNAAVQTIADPYVKSVGEGRYLEAGGRLFFDIAATLLGASEARALAKGTGTAAKGTRLASQWTPQQASQAAQAMGRKLATSPASELAFRKAATEIADSMRANGLTAQADLFLKEAETAITDGLKAHERSMKSGKGYGGQGGEKVEWVPEASAGAKGRPKPHDLSEKPGVASGSQYLKEWP